MGKAKQSYTAKVEALAKHLEIDESVAMDVEYLRSLEGRIVRIAKKNPSLRNFLVHNPALEEQLEELERK